MSETYFKECCVGFYGRPEVAFLLGDSWHPGGLELTRELAEATGVNRKAVVLDVGCGVGTSALFLSRVFGCDVTAIDLSRECLLTAERRADEVKIENVRFYIADSEYLPFLDARFDMALSECSISILEDKRAALGEINRVLKVGGKMGFSDVVVEGQLPEDLRGPLSQLMCLAGAPNLETYTKLLESCGLKVIRSRKENAYVLELIESFREKLFTIELLKGIGKLHVKDEDIAQAKQLLKMATVKVGDGTLGYMSIIARKE